MRRALVCSIEFGLSDAYGYHRVEQLPDTRKFITTISTLVSRLSHSSRSITRHETLLSWIRNTVCTNCVTICGDLPPKRSRHVYLNPRLPGTD